MFDDNLDHSYEMLLLCREVRILLCDTRVGYGLCSKLQSMS